MTGSRDFRAVVTRDAKGGIHLPLDFDPDEEWGPKPRHHVTGSINGMGVRGPLHTTRDGGWALQLGPAWGRGSGLSDGDEVLAILAPEGPQRDDLEPDIAAALDAEPEAGAFFDSLAQFYRKGYLTWVRATKRRPDVRAARIAEMVEFLKAGHKQRPRS